MKQKPVQAGDLHRRWREYLANWDRSREFIVKAAEVCPRQKLFETMKNRHKKHAVAKYLFQARNSDTHVGRVVEQKPTSVDIGGFIKINSDNVGCVTVSDNHQIGSDGVARPSPNFSGSIERGEVKTKGSLSDNVLISSP